MTPPEKRNLKLVKDFAITPKTITIDIWDNDIEDGDRVLELGTATGYGAAVLALMAKTVVALEHEVALAAAARATFAGLEIANAIVVTGPLSAGWAPEAPYAAILVAGAVPEIPAALLDQLQDGGRLAAVVTGAGVGQLTQWRRFGSQYASRHVGDAFARPLPGFERAAGFAF